MPLFIVNLFVDLIIFMYNLTNAVNYNIMPLIHNILKYYFF